MLQEGRGGGRLLPKRTRHAVHMGPLREQGVEDCTRASPREEALSYGAARRAANHLYV